MKSLYSVIAVAAFALWFFIEGAVTHGFDFTREDAVMDAAIEEEDDLFSRFKRDSGDDDDDDDKDKDDHCCTVPWLAGYSADFLNCNHLGYAGPGNTNATHRKYFGKIPFNQGVCYNSEDRNKEGSNSGSSSDSSSDSSNDSSNDIRGNRGRNGDSFVCSNRTDDNPVCIYRCLFTTSNALDESGIPIEEKVLDQFSKYLPENSEFQDAMKKVNKKCFKRMKKAIEKKRDSDTIDTCAMTYALASCIHYEIITECPANAQSTFSNDKCQQLNAS